MPPGRHSVEGPSRRAAGERPSLLPGQGMRANVKVQDAVEKAPVKKAGWDASLGIHRAVLRGRRRRRVADVLHGTWLGHPLHPALTDLTIGAWLIGGAFDAVGELRDSPAARRTGDHLAAVGTAAAVPTALSGLADFSTFPEGSSRPATLHGLLNAVNMGLYGLSLRDRRNGNRRRGLAFSWIAQGLTLASAWLGGQLVYKHRVGVDHSDSFTGPKEWTPVLDEAELPEGKPKRVEVEGKGLFLYREDGRVHAIGSVCSHAGGPLEEGEVRGCTVRCPWHDSVFDLRDGGIVHGPATRPQPSFETRVREGRVEVLLRHG